MNNLEQPWAIASEALTWVSKALGKQTLCFAHGYIDAWDEAVQLVGHVLGWPADPDQSRQTDSVSLAEQRQIQALTAERISARKPVAYIIQKAWFMGHAFYVDERVLIPRSPFAECIKQRFTPWLNCAVEDILEIGTGSGCMSIAAAHQWSSAHCDAVDISADALDVARYNVQQHGLTERVNLIQSDVYKNLPAKQYDLIISNPPYVSHQEWSDLPEEFKHEPQSGLVAADSGLSIIWEILLGAKERLKPEGLLAIEAGYSADLLQHRLAKVPLIWPDLEDGGYGIFLLNYETICEYHDEFIRARDK